MATLITVIAIIGANVAWFTEGGVAEKVYRWCLIVVAWAAAKAVLS